MLSTAEVRWFAQGERPLPVVAWFRGLEAPLWEEEPRVDHYLPLRDTDSVGIKVREGRVEIKRRYRAPRPVHFGGNLSGSLEWWTKWGFDLREGPQPLETFEDLAAWTAVRKTRMMHGYAIERGTDVVTLSGATPPDQGCSVELTQVSVEEQLWWTLGFEAIGELAALEKILQVTVRHVLADADVLKLGLEASFGYPRWLQLLSDKA